MTGDRERARDVVQDIQVKFLEHPIPEMVADPRNYIIRTTVNHCLNLKKREDRLRYTGLWLPEPPGPETGDMDPHAAFERRDVLGYELAYLMEQLSPAERAVFVLREAFAFSHREIAVAIAISEDNARQLLKRAKAKIGRLSRHSLSDPASLDIAQKFIALIEKGDTAALIALFNEDIALLADSGGKAPAIGKTLLGPLPVARFFMKLISNKAYAPVFSFTRVLKQPAVVIRLGGEVIAVQVLSVRDHRISRIFAILNPDKLGAFRENP